MTKQAVMLTWYNTTTPKPTPQDIAFMTGDDVKDVISWLSDGDHCYPPRDWRDGSIEQLRTCTCGIQYWHSTGSNSNSHNCNVKTIWRM